LAAHYPGGGRVTETILKEAERLVKRTPHPIKYQAEQEFEKAHSRYRLGDNIGAFKAAYKAISIAEEAGRTAKR